MSSKKKNHNQSDDEDYEESEPSSSSDEQNEDNGDDSDDSERKNVRFNSKSSPKKSNKQNKNILIAELSDCQYEVVKYVTTKMFGMKATYDFDSEWDLRWTDNAVQPEVLARMHEHQRINHFPGMYSLARKNHLGKNLMRMRKSFPENYKYFPPTWLLPSEYNDFKNQFSKTKNKTFIVKPEAMSQGKGIFLTRTCDSIQPGEHYVAQRYIAKPFLIDGLKFDLRIYVLLAGCDPLRIYLYDDGLGRFATETYVSPCSDNLDNICMHLTNYAINKDNPNFVFNEDAKNDGIGHKRSLKAVLKQLQDMGHDTKWLWEEIKKIIIKTFCSVQPILAHSYKSCHPDEPYNNMCFELLGFDIMIDHKFKPWLIEVNHTPSFTTDTPLDRQIKKGAIRDAIKLMNISLEHKLKIKNKKKAELQQRVLTGKKVKLTPEERLVNWEIAQKERDVYEAQNCGSYEKIFPFDDPSKSTEDYEEFMRVSQKWYEEWTGISIRRALRRNQEQSNKPPPMIFGISSYPVRPKETPPTIKLKPQLQKLPSSSNINKDLKNPNSSTNVQTIQEITNGPLEQVQEDDREFLDHIEAIGNTRVIGEDEYLGEEHEGSQFMHRSLVQSVSALQKIHAKDGDDYAEPETDKSITSPMRSNVSKITEASSPTKIDSKGQTQFRIRPHNVAVPIVRDSAQIVKTNLSSGGEETSRLSILKKSLVHPSEQKVEVRTPRTESMNPTVKKIPLKMSNGVIGEMADYIYENNQKTLYRREPEKSNMNKRTALSPQPVYTKHVNGNFVQPKVLEFSLPFPVKQDDVLGKQPTGNGYLAPALNVIKANSVPVKKDTASNFAYYSDQMALHRYYANIFQNNNRKF